MVNINPNSPNVSTFIVSVGDIIKIQRPPGYPPYPISGKDGNTDGFAVPESAKEPTIHKAYGFTVLDTNLGEFIIQSKFGWSDGYVFYRHDRSGRQAIRYLSHGIIDVTLYMLVTGIEVHDHASVYQGGPAYATYWAQVPAEATEEGD
jgi:hypothetical protein